MRVDENLKRKVMFVGMPTEVLIEKPVEKPAIHIVHILDGSGSMGGFRDSKFNSAITGMKEEVELLKNDVEVNYIYSITEFDYSYHIVKICDKVNINNVNIDKLNFFNPSGQTALYDAVGITLTDLLNNTKNEKVIVKIFTDGGENGSTKFRSNAVSILVDLCNKRGFVITFIGTHSDVDIIQRDLHISKSNTLSHDNTTKGMTAAYQTVNSATMNYSKSVLRGNATTDGFFNNENKK